MQLEKFIKKWTGKEYDKNISPHERYEIRLMISKIIMSGDIQFSRDFKYMLLRQAQDMRYQMLNTFDELIHDIEKLPTDNAE